MGGQREAGSTRRGGTPQGGGGGWRRQEGEEAGGRRLTTRLLARCQRGSRLEVPLWALLSAAPPRAGCPSVPPSVRPSGLLTAEAVPRGVW